MCNINIVELGECNCSQLQQYFKTFKIQTTGTLNMKIKGKFENSAGKEQKATVKYQVMIKKPENKHKALSGWHLNIFRYVHLGGTLLGLYYSTKPTSSASKKSC